MITAGVMLELRSSPARTSACIADSDVAGEADVRLAAVGPVPDQHLVALGGERLSQFADAAVSLLNRPPGVIDPGTARYRCARRSTSYAIDRPSTVAIAMGRS